MSADTYCTVMSGTVCTVLYAVYMRWPHAHIIIYWMDEEKKGEGLNIYTYMREGINIFMYMHIDDRHTFFIFIDINKGEYAIVL